MKTGLSLAEVAFLLGYPSDVTVSRHATNKSVPPFFIGLAYEALYGLPASKLFVGLKDQAKLFVANRLKQLLVELESLKITHPALPADAAHKLTWISERLIQIEESNGQ